jgi:hypothetical protein
MTERLQARLADLLGGDGEHTQRRNVRLTKRRQKAVDEIITRESELLEQIRLMESRLNAFEDAKFGIGSYDPMARAGINRGTINAGVSGRVHQGLSALQTVRNKWSLTDDPYKLVKDWNYAANRFESVLDGPLPKAIKDAHKLMQAADSGEFVGPHATPDGHALMLRNGTVKVDPRPYLGLGLAFADELTMLLTKLVKFCRGRSVEEPLSEQLEETTGFSW